VFPCKDLKLHESEINTSIDILKKSKNLLDIFLVVTESVFLVLEPDHKIKNVARLVAWASLGALESIKRNMEK
jgi:hypothetical protein